MSIVQGCESSTGGQQSEMQYNHYCDSWRSHLWTFWH